MGLWFIANTLGNFVAGLIEGNINIKNIDQLPKYFWTMHVDAFCCSTFTFYC